MNKAQGDGALSLEIQTVDWSAQERRCSTGNQNQHRSGACERERALGCVKAALGGQRMIGERNLGSRIDVRKRRSVGESELAILVIVRLPRPRRLGWL